MTKHLPSVLGGISAGLSVLLAGAFGVTFWVLCIAAGCGGFAGNYHGQNLAG